MAHYLMMFRFTQQGSTGIKESPARIDAAKELARQMECKVKDCYALMGAYDTVFILEAPNDETAARLSLAIGSLGNVHAETMRAFTEEEFRGIVGKLR
jgi:uncharacterized protein with GYD domain